jgi:hypothetical protein
MSSTTATFSGNITAGRRDARRGARPGFSGRSDAAGRPVRQIELCDRHAEIVIVHERTRGFEIFDRHD